MRQTLFTPTDLFALGIPCGVHALVGDLDGTPALRLTLAEDRRGGKLGVDFGDEPTFLALPDLLVDGEVELGLRARLLPDAPDYARGFIGLAYRCQQNGTAFEGLYLRPLNGLAHTPPAPRDRRAVQYFAYPDWKYDRLRDTLPDQFEAPADIALDRWHRLRVRFAQERLSAWVDGALVMTLDHTLGQPISGQIGLWVDIGTEGWFSSVRVTKEQGEGAR